MAFETKTPMALYKANLELVMRLGALLQETRQRWTRFGLSSTDNAVEKTLSETGRMLTTNDWKSLATLPGETFWKALQGDVGPMQGAVDVAVNNQAAFAQGLQDAFAAWQQQCADALQGSGVSLPGNATIEEFLKTFSAKSGFAGAFAGKPAPTAASAAAPKTPARPSKPAAARKPAASVRKAKPLAKKATAKKKATVKKVARRK